MQITERILPDARDFVGIQQQQLQRCQTAEHIGWQFFDFITVQHSGGG